MNIDGYPVKNYWLKGKTYPPNYNKLRLLLIQRYGICYFCGIPVRDYPHVDGENFKLDLATIDHLEPRQYRKRGEIVEKVLACYKCNQIRNNREQKKAIK